MDASEARELTFESMVSEDKEFLAGILNQVRTAAMGSVCLEDRMHGSFSVRFKMDFAGPNCRSLVVSYLKDRGFDLRWLHSDGDGDDECDLSWDQK